MALDADFLRTLQKRLLPHGLLLRGGFSTQDAGDLPAGLDDVSTILLIGNAGPDLWRQSSASLDGNGDALDRWTRSVMNPIAGDVGAAVVYPFGGPPYFPFQQWAMKAEPVFSSPLGILMHPRYGLWHAYRAALCFPQPVPMPAKEVGSNPCDSCTEKPCLSACPVGAFADGQDYDVPACAGHLRSPDGKDCMSFGCRARRACPVGRDYLYDAGQAAFHMDAFIKARPAGS